MEAQWISVLIGGRAPPPVLRALFSIFRVKICRGGTQVVVAVPRAIKISRLQSHLSGNVERLVEVVCSSRIFVWLFGYSDRQGASSAVLKGSIVKPREGTSRDLLIASMITPGAYEMYSPVVILPLAHQYLFVGDTSLPSAHISPVRRRYCMAGPPRLGRPLGIIIPGAYRHCAPGVLDLPPANTA
jgi:hypothetical protein